MYNTSDTDRYAVARVIVPNRATGAQITKAVDVALGMACATDMRGTAASYVADNIIVVITRREATS